MTREVALAVEDQTIKITASGGGDSGISDRNSCGIRSDTESSLLAPYSSENGLVSFLRPCGWTQVKDLDPSYGEIPF